MIVKVGDLFFDSLEHPIMIILEEQDKWAISNMHPDQFKYCSYNDEKHTEAEIKEWMSKDGSK